MERNQRILLILCVIYCLWSIGTQWTTTLLSFLQWDTIHEKKRTKQKNKMTSSFQKETEKYSSIHYYNIDKLSCTQKPLSPVYSLFRLLCHKITKFISKVMTIVDIGYIQSFGSFCNAIGALVIGQIADTTGPKTMFLFSSIIIAIYYSALSFARCWYSFLFLQFLRVGYQLDATIEMYLATITTERERTSALMRLTVPQAISMLLGPMFASQLAVKTTLRTSQFFCGIALIVTITPIIYYFLPQTHSVPKLATARLRPQDYLPMIKHNVALREGIFLRGLLIAAYICYELIYRNFLLRSYMQGPSDSAKVLIVMGASLLTVQFFLMPYLQRRLYPRTVLIIALIGLSCAYFLVNFTTNFNQLLGIVAVHTACYAVAYAESYTQITSAVDTMDLGKATGLGSAIQWIIHFIVPIYISHVVQSWHYTYAFYTSALLSIGALCYVILVARHSNARAHSLLPSISLM